MMLISEVSKHTDLTKKAIAYYIDQGLICPAILENGYREFSEEDVERLQKIAVLRRLGLSISEIQAVLADKTTKALQKISTQKALDQKREQIKLAALSKLGSGTSYAEIYRELRVMSQSEAIIDRLLDAFPGYYGRFICLHFSRFINMPITSEEQQTAYEEVLAFLDQLPSLSLSPELEQVLEESTGQITTQSIEELLDHTRQAVESPEAFLIEHKETLQAYLEFRQSEAYSSSPMHQLRESLLMFYKANGYYERFIPAMQRLSPAYAEYHRQIILANEQLLAQYPKIAELYSEIE